MACARGANEEDGACNPDISRSEDGRDPQDEVQRSILVSYIPEGVNRDKLEIHFMRRSNGGGDIESITMVTDDEAKISYLDGAVVESILEKPHVLNGVEVKVQKWTPPEVDTKSVSATAEDSRSILVSNIPDGVNMDKLQIHFMRRSNGGDDIKSITMVTDTEARITYLDGAAVERVLERPQVLNGVEVLVQKWTSSKEHTKVGATAVETSRSILVSNIPEGVSWDELKIYFTEAANGGGKIESITMVTETVAMITYVDSAAVKTVLGKQHVLNGIKVAVQEEGDPEVFEEVHATVSTDVVHLIPQDLIEKIKIETGITWEKGAGDDVIDVKGTFKQVEEAQQLLEEHIKQWLESANDSTTTAHKENSPTTDGKHSPKDDPKKTKLMERKIRITALDGGQADMDVDHPNKRMKQESHVNPDTARKDGGSCMTGRQRNGDMPVENTSATTASNQDTDDAPHNGNDNVAQEEDSKGISSQGDDTRELKMQQYDATETFGDEGLPQQIGEQTEDAANNSSAYEDTTSTSEEDKLKLGSASGPSNEEERPGGSADKNEDMEDFKDAKEKPEKREMGAPDSAKGKESSSRESTDKGNDAEEFKDAEGKPEKMDLGAPESAKDKESSSRGSADKDEDTEAFSDAAEEPEKMETDETHDSAKNKPLPDDDEPMPSDDDDPQTQAPSTRSPPEEPNLQAQISSKNSSPPEKPIKDAPSDPKDDAGYNNVHVPGHGDQKITENVQDDPSDTTDGDGGLRADTTDGHGDLRATDSDASPDDSTTSESSKSNESSDYNDVEATQSGGPERRNEAFYKEKLDKNGMPVDQLSTVASDTTGKLDTGKGHKADGADCTKTGSDQEENSQFEVPVDPDVLTYLRHKHHAEITDIGKRYKSVFKTSADNTKASFAPTRSVGKDPEPDKAMDEFITLYQQVFSKITCENFDVAQYNFAPTYLLNGVRSIRVIHNEVLTNVNKDNTTVTFMGEPEKVRQTRAAFCGMMGISITRGSRRRGKSPSTSTSTSTSTDPEGSSTDLPKGAEGGDNSPVVLFTHTFEQGIEVKVAHGNITTLNVDAIVNAADAYLRHGGGVAKAIVQAGGDIIQEESTKKMKKRGFLKPTETEITGAGSLPCKNIIHAHGPKWQDNQAKQCTDMLTKTCINILQAAEGLNAQSVAIPAISSGKYGMPKHLCAQALLSGVNEYISKKHAPTCSLKDIWFIDMTGETIEVLVEVFATEIPLLQSQSRPMYEKAKPKPTAKQHSRASQPPVSSQTQNKTYASVAAKGNGKTKSSPASGPSHRNDSSQVAALISPGKGPGYAQQVTQDRSSQQGKGGATGGGKNSNTGTATRVKTSGQPNTGKEKNDETCPICLSGPTNPQSLPCQDQGCKAVFCKKCLDKAMNSMSRCPVCTAVVGKLIGNQPEGEMIVTYNRKMTLDGYKQPGAIIIDYFFKDGTQGPEHPNPGKPYRGTSRTAYLPRNTDGGRVLSLLKQAFNQKLIFTIGTSSTTGKSNTVVWNDIHHKTSTYGGPSMHGYPDPGYLKRVTDELAAKGIRSKARC